RRRGRRRDPSQGRPRDPGGVPKDPGRTRPRGPADGSGRGHDGRPPPLWVGDPHRGAGVFEVGGSVGAVGQLPRGGAAGGGRARPVRSPDAATTKGTPPWPGGRRRSEGSPLRPTRSCPEPAVRDGRTVAGASFASTAPAAGRAARRTPWGRSG